MPGYQDSRDINGRKYTVYRLPFGIGNAPDSMRGILSLIGNIMTRSSHNVDKEIDIIAKFISMSNSDDARKIVEVLGSRSEYFDGEKSFILDENFQNIHWSDNPADFLPWLIFALEVNFKDFFIGGTNILSNFAEEGSKDKEKAEKTKTFLQGLIGSRF